VRLSAVEFGLIQDTDSMPAPFAGSIAFFGDNAVGTHVPCPESLHRESAAESGNPVFNLTLGAGPMTQNYPLPALVLAVRRINLAERHESALRQWVSF
jgi:hypothetical protein